MCEICSRLTRKALERCHCCRSGVFNSENIAHIVSIADFKQVNKQQGRNFFSRNRNLQQFKIISKHKMESKVTVMSVSLASVKLDTEMRVT